MPMRRIGECIYHAVQMHRSLGCGDASIDFSIEMKGLSNRTLVYWPSQFGLREAGGRSYEDTFSNRFSFCPPAEGAVTAETLLSVLKEPLDTLFEQFAFAKVSASVYIQEFKKMMRA